MITYNNFYSLIFFETLKYRDPYRKYNELLTKIHRYYKDYLFLPEFKKIMELAHCPTTDLPVTLKKVLETRNAVENNFEHPILRDIKKLTACFSLAGLEIAQIIINLSFFTYSIISTTLSMNLFPHYNRMLFNFKYTLYNILRKFFYSDFLCPEQIELILLVIGSVIESKESLNIEEEVTKKLIVTYFGATFWKAIADSDSKIIQTFRYNKLIANGFCSSQPWTHGGKLIVQGMSLYAHFERAYFLLTTNNTQKLMDSYYKDIEQLSKIVQELQNKGYLIESQTKSSIPSIP